MKTNRSCSGPPRWKSCGLGVGIPEEHIKDMDEDGVYGSIVFPTVGLDLYQNIPDSDLLTEMFRVYNDWLAEFCKPFPDRLKGVACINVDDVKSGSNGAGTLRQNGTGRRNECRLPVAGQAVQPAGIRRPLGGCSGPPDALSPARDHQPPWARPGVYIGQRCLDPGLQRQPGLLGANVVGQHHL